MFSFLSFAGNTAGMVVWNTLIQTRVPAEMLGRVSSLDWFVSIGLLPVSFALTGPVAELVGAKATLVGAGVLGSLAAPAAVRARRARPGGRAVARRRRASAA